jgi:HEAT repeat protein
VVAYHGPKQRSDDLDAAIVARAKELNDPRFTAYALLGFVAFAREAPSELLKLGLDADDPRVRTAAVRAMGSLAGDAPVARLRQLLKDPEPRVRAQAARVLGFFGRNTPPATIKALVDALRLEGDTARVRICQTLGMLTGQRRPYDPQASAEQKQQTIEFWNDWLGAAQPDSDGNDPSRQ